MLGLEPRAMCIAHDAVAQVGDLSLLHLASCCALVFLRAKGCKRMNPSFATMMLEDRVRRACGGCCVAWAFKSLPSWKEVFLYPTRVGPVITLRTPQTHVFLVLRLGWRGAQSTAIGPQLKKSSHIRPLCGEGRGYRRMHKRVRLDDNYGPRRTNHSHGLVVGGCCILLGVRNGGLRNDDIIWGGTKALFFCAPCSCFLMLLIQPRPRRSTNPRQHL